jgi:hypothetical protein
MNRLARIALVVLGLVVLEQAASAQGTCREAKGNTVEVFNGTNTAAGTLTNAGWLDGTIVAVFYGTGYPTPNPTEVTFASTFTLTTKHGQLKGNRIYLYDLVTGQSTIMMKIDPTAGTGIFAGATGLLFFNELKNTMQTTFYSVVGGQVCFADQNNDD